MTQISNNITEILALHEELLSKLHSILQDLGKPSQEEIANIPTRPSGHIRWHSVDSPTIDRRHTVTKAIRRSLDLARPRSFRTSLAGSEPELVGRVAKIFEEMV